jgi:hypothetical protein
MSDFDERVRRALEDESEHAPDASGLAQAARGRLRARRRRLAAVGGVAVLMAVAVPVVALGLGGSDGDDLDAADTTAPAGEWKWAVVVDARAEIPGDWSKHTCDFDGFESEIYAPTQNDACQFGTYLAFYPSATFDPADMPGVITASTDEGKTRWSGYVYTGDYAVSVSTGDRDLTRRILASTRDDMQPEIDGSEWQTLEGLDLRVDVLLRWGLGPDADLDDYAVCAALGERNDPPEMASQPGTRSTWVSFDYRDGRWISVSAPTQAVADLVLASVQTTPGSNAIGCLSESGVHSVA